MISVDERGFGRCAGCGQFGEVFSLSCLCPACLDERWQAIGGPPDDDYSWLLGDDE